tara:strand:+ start:690 stop:1007 length:318 start_codon:yes stop_codon:yes gene_type:complete
MLTQKISKLVNKEEDKYMIYLGILQAISGFKITEQEKKILSRILESGELTKNVKEELESITSKARIDNVISKFRRTKILVGNKPNSKFLNLKGEGMTFNIVLKNA